MKLNTLYKNVNNMDVAFHTSKVHVTKHGLRVFGYWVNVVSKNHYVVSDEYIFINNRDIDKWYVYEGDKK